MAFLRSMFAKLTRRPKDEAVELIHIHPVPPVIGPGAWSRPMIVLGATPKRATNPIDLELMLKRSLAMHMVELDWVRAIEEDTLRQAARDVMPAPAQPRARRRL